MIGTLNANTGVLTIERNAANSMNVPGPEGLFARMPEVEKNQFEVFGWKHGLQPHKKLSRPQIEAYSMAVPAIQQAIDYIISRIISFPYKVVRVDGKKHNNFSQKRADRAAKVMQGPNQFGFGYRSTMKMFLTCLLKWDLGTIEKQILPFGGIINQINAIDSSTMRPNPKNFQGDLSQAAYYEMSSMYLETVVRAYSREQILWANLNPQPGSFYGFSPIEYLDLAIMMYVYSTQHNLKLVNPENERGGGIVFLPNLGQKQRKEFEDRYKVWRMQDPGAPIFASSQGDNPPVFVDLSLKEIFNYPELESAISEIAVASYGLTMQDIGRSTKGATGATAEQQDNITQKSAIIPRVLMLEEILTNGIIVPTGGDDLKLMFVTKKEEPLQARATTASMMVGKGILTLNQGKDLVDDTIPDIPAEVGDVHFIISGSQVARADELLKKGNYQKILDKSNKPNIENPNNQNDPAKRTTQKKNDRGIDQNWS
jgi:hypothetical protein